MIQSRKAFCILLRPMIEPLPLRVGIESRRESYANRAQYLKNRIQLGVAVCTQRTVKAFPRKPRSIGDPFHALRFRNVAKCCRDERGVIRLECSFKVSFNSFGAVEIVSRFIFRSLDAY